jgi:hypothetical protein
MQNANCKLQIVEFSVGILQFAIFMSQFAISVNVYAMPFQRRKPHSPTRQPMIAR